MYTKKHIQPTFQQVHLSKLCLIQQIGFWGKSWKHARAPNKPNLMPTPFTSLRDLMSKVIFYRRCTWEHGILRFDVSMANLLGVQKGNARPLVSPKGRRVTGCAVRCITVSNTGLLFYRNSQKGGLGLGHNPEIRNSSRTLDVIESTQKCLHYRWQVVG